MLNFFKSQAFGGVILILFGFVFLWGMRGITKDLFLNTDTFEVFKKFTPLPPIFNFYLIQTILGLGALISICGGIFSFIRPLLKI